MFYENKYLYDLGFHLHWLRPNSKSPLEAKWSSLEKKTFKELKETYRKGYNVGTLLGRPLTDGTYLAVIDCDMKSTDPAHRKEMLEKLGELLPDFEDAPIVKSGRGNGSMHVYVRTKKELSPYRYSQSSEKVTVFMPSVEASRKDRELLSEKEIRDGFRMRAAWEISIMGKGQQVVLPPSIHPDSGKAYKWQNDIESLEDIPLAEFERVESERTFKTLEDFEVEEVDLLSCKLSDEMVDLILSGAGGEDRSADLMRACLSMINANFTDNQILTVLTDRENYLGSAGYDHAQTNSRKRAAKWVYKYTLAKARLMNSAENDFEKLNSIDDLKDVRLEEEDKASQEERIRSLTWWGYRLERTEGKNGIPGKIKGTLKNLLLIFANDLDPETFKRDLFAIKDFYGADTPWGGVKGKEITDYDILLLKQWLGSEWKYEPTNVIIEEAVSLACGKNEYHPVRDFIDNLEWDGVSRLDFWLKKYLGAVGPRKYLQAVGVKTLTAMIKRIYEPGCKFDHVLILEGEQGIGKSTVVNTLAAPWFSDQDLTVGDKDTVLAIQANWIMELGELSSMGKADTDLMKAFVARRVDRIRAPYGKKTQDYPRQCIFIGTTNNDEYLKDKTGNRRYWPVKVKEIAFDELEADRDQLLAEAKFCYELGEPLYLEDPDVAELAKIEQGIREERDELENILMKVLDHNEEKAAEGFNLSDLAEWDGEGFTNIGLISIKTKYDQMRLGACLRSLGYERRQERRGDNRLKKWYKKEA